MKAARNKSGRGLGSMPEYLDRSRWPVEPWRLVESRYESHDLGLTETLFAVGNGYLGLRGNVLEGRETFQHGTFVNGFHETWPIRHAEEAFGFARIGQTIVNVPDAKVMRLYVDDEPLLLSVADLQSYERALDFRTGVLTRDLVWLTPTGNRVRLRTRRMVSFTQRHLAIMTFEVTLLDRDAPIVVSSQIINREAGIDEYDTATANPDDPDEAAGPTDPRKAEAFGGRVLQPTTNFADDYRSFLGYRCTNSRMTLAVAADHNDRDRERLPHLRRVRRGLHEAGLSGARGGREAHHDHEGRQLSHVPGRSAERARQPVPTHPGPGQGPGRREAVRRTSGPGSRASGSARTSSSRTSLRRSRPSGSTSSHWPRPGPGPRATAYRPRG